MSRVRRLLNATSALVAAAAVGVAVWMAFAGSTEALSPVREPAQNAFRALESGPIPPAVAVGLLLVGCSLVLFVAVRSGGAETPAWSAAESDPELVDASETAVVGSEFEQRFASREGESPPWDDDDIEGRIRRLAVDTLANRRPGPRDRAADAVETGAWTDDQRAAAYLGDDVRASLPVRIWDWLSAEPRRRRYARRALAEIASVRGESR